MCIHTYCTFHSKPKHVSAIREGRNIGLLQTELRQKCLLISVSHLLLTLKSLLWPCISLTSGIFIFFYCGFISSLQMFSQLILLSEHCLSSEISGTVTCVLQLPVTRKIKKPERIGRVSQVLHIQLMNQLFCVYKIIPQIPCIKYC